MKIEEQDFSYREEARLREKQAVCPHPSFKCSLCGKYKDNLFNEYRAEIDVLLMILNHYEHILDIFSIPHPRYFELLDDGIIDMWKKDKIIQYIEHERKPEDQ